MTMIRQTSLFGIQELYEMEPTQRYESIISAIDLDRIFHEVNKKSRLGAPVELNYAAMIISCFYLHCGTYPDDTPFEAAYSRLKFNESRVLEEEQEKVVLQAITECFIIDDTVANDATHFEACDQAPSKEEKPKTEPKKTRAQIQGRAGTMAT